MAVLRFFAGAGAMRGLVVLSGAGGVVDRGTLAVVQGAVRSFAKTLRLSVASLAIIAGGAVAVWPG